MIRMVKSGKIIMFIVGFFKCKTVTENNPKESYVPKIAKWEILFKFLKKVSTIRSSLVGN